MVRSAKRASGSEETKQRIVNAALETLRTEGIVGTSARAIARTGNFNQALIFYHFGSVDQVLLAALEQLSAERIARYEPRLAKVTTFADLVAVARELHDEDSQEGNLTILSQLVAGSFAQPDLGKEVLARFDPWMDLIARAVERVIKGTPYEHVVPVDDLAFAVTSLFLGIELLTRLDPERAREQSLFAAFDMLAVLVTALLDGEASSQQ